ncbi:imidazole glycerol phosphate synthase subunit HisH [Sphingomonas piscis]|uniref:Imidazole glycerol phosphate synthase subunit HisH n=2 Tax=Sphingomonas piscis TaxID=2714943 RepID=A0A6G7YSY7_9SPHN|nr:imidazole glycerol phosphate synthase subunit HisH [Sphingomonas piscis]
MVDLGCGNTGSVSMALERLGITSELTVDPEVITSADKVLLPGVGAAGYAMDQVRRLGLGDVLRTLDRPALGICLGMQLLFERSEEDEGVETLGIIQGSVRKLGAAPGRPVPHMGWSKLEVFDDSVGLSYGDYVYFAHSFACDDGPASVARAQYGRPVPAVVRKNNWTGAQFHPERSGPVGARFIETWLNS